MINDGPSLETFKIWVQKKRGEEDIQFTIDLIEEFEEEIINKLE